MNTRFFIFGSLLILSIARAIGTMATTSIPYTMVSDYGIASQLPLFYWVGLLAVLILSFLGRSSKKQLAIVFALVVVYLFVVPTVVQENATLLGTSYPASEGQQLATTGNLPEDLYSIYKYHNFPGFLYFTGILTSITGIPLVLICKYAPPLFALLIGVIVYLIFRLKLNSSNSIMGAIWFLASWWWVAGNYFSPQEVAFVFFGLVFLIFSRFAFGYKSHDRSLVVIVFVLLGATIFTHAFTSIMLLSCFVPLLLFNKIKTGRVMAFLLLVSEVAYLVLWATPFTTWAASRTLEELPTLLSSQFGRAVLPGSSSQIFTNDFRYFTMLITLSILAIFVFSVILKREKNTEKYWLLCVVGMALPIAATAYGMSETIIRFFMFALIPLSYICVKFISKKPAVLVFLVCLLIVANVPAHYGGSTVEGVSSSEIAGASFYINHVPAGAPYFSLTAKTTYLMWFISPYSVQFPVHLNVLSPISDESVLPQPLRYYQFIVYSQADVNQFLYYHNNVPLNESNFAFFNKIYDNPFIKLYENSTFVEIPLPPGN
ncbi:MAG: hypothetical protein NWF01_08140 [Candidatus Bathyarchaeota archaeon]|nr:hypothetical protein [Candidatus Bathyarchaeota archaeon]